VALQVLYDVCMCGYRPNLTRRHESITFYSYQGQTSYFEYAESVALDNTMNLTQVSAPQIDEVTSGAFLNFHLFSSTFHLNCHLSTYLITRWCYDKDTMVLISETLRNFYKTASTWNSNGEYLNSCAKVRVYHYFVSYIFLFPAPR
jgi:hypothetical protein